MSRREESPSHKKLEKILQDLLWGVFKKEKHEEVVMDTISPKNLENSKKTLVNREIWKKLSTKQNLLTLDFKKSKN